MQIYPLGHFLYLKVRLSVFNNFEFSFNQLKENCKFSPPIGMRNPNFFFISTPLIIFIEMVITYDTF